MAHAFWHYTRCHISARRHNEDTPMGRCSEPGFPHKGWIWVGISDARDDKGLSYDDYPSCEYCDQPHIRGIHTIRHPTFPDTVRVGCDCVVKLTEEYADAQRAERNLRNKVARRRNFPKRKEWKTSAKGNDWIFLDGYHVVVIPQRNGSYRLRIDGDLGKLTFPTLKEAQLRAFDVVQRKIQKGQKG